MFPDRLGKSVRLTTTSSEDDINSVSFQAQTQMVTCRFHQRDTLHVIQWEKGKKSVGSLSIASSATSDPHQTLARADKQSSWRRENLRRDGADPFESLVTQIQWNGMNLYRLQTIITPGGCSYSRSIKWTYEKQPEPYIAAKTNYYMSMCVSLCVYSVESVAS